VGGMKWPLVLITTGLLLFANQLGWHYGFRTLWPIILIVIGVMKVAEALAPTTNHVSA
jgi:hypothetical protein